MPHLLLWLIQRHALTPRIYPVKGLQVLAAATFLQEKRLW